LKEESILHRIKRARETYHDAIYLYGVGSINSCVNRLYYAAFYATLALLLDKGIVPKETAKIFGILSDYRHKGDYDDLFEFDREVVDRLLMPVKEYIDIVESLITGHQR